MVIIKFWILLIIITQYDHFNINNNITVACTKFFDEYNIYKHGGHLNLGYFMVEY